MLDLGRRDCSLPNLMMEGLPDFLEFLILEDDENEDEYADAD